MSYKTPLASTTDYGTVKVGVGISVTNGIISSSSSYSTGTWKPSLVSSLPAIFTLITSNANYCKTGQLVTCTFDFTVLTEVGGSGAGIVTLHGLPFTSIAETNSGYVGSVYVSYFINMDSDTGWLTGSVVDNSTVADMFFGSAQPKSLTKLTQGDIKPTTRLVGTITYLSAI